MQNWTLALAKPFDFESFDEEIQEAIKAGVKEGFADIEAFVKEHATDPLSSTKMFGTRSFLNQSAKENYNYENIFLPRAVAADRGLYGNSAAEATYPMYFVDAEGKPLNAAENNYTLPLKKMNFLRYKLFGR